MSSRKRLQKTFDLVKSLDLVKILLLTEKFTKSRLDCIRLNGTFWPVLFCHFHLIDSWNLADVSNVFFSLRLNPRPKAT